MPTNKNKIWRKTMPYCVPLNSFITFVVTFIFSYILLKIKNKQPESECNSDEEILVLMDDRQICKFALLAAIAFTISIVWIQIAINSYLSMNPLTDQDKLTKEIDIFFKGAAGIAATIYFIYQAIAGSFFATTNILLEANFFEKSNQYVVKATIERGDNWCVNIKEAMYLLEEKSKTNIHIWTDMKFPKREDGIHILAPKEKTHTEFVVSMNGCAEITVTARVISFATWWPKPARSFARLKLIDQLPLNSPNQPSISYGNS